MLNDAENNENESMRFIQESYCLPSINLHSINSCECFLGLPELPLHSSVSADIAFLSGWDKHEECVVKTSTGVLDAPVLQIEVVDPSITGEYPSTPKSTGKEKETQLKRSRHEVHSISEKKRRSRINGKLKTLQELMPHCTRKRRSRINGKLKTLQELMPHCTRKDRASVLDEAAKYIQALKQHVETMTKARGLEIRDPYMSYSGLHCQQWSLVPMQQGPRMCVPCYTPFFQLPLPVVSSSSSTVAGVCIPTTCMAGVDPTSRSFLS